MGRYTVFRFDQTITMVLSVVIALEDVLESWKWSDVVGSPLVHMILSLNRVYLV